MTAPVNMTNCPSDETLAAFIDGRLEDAARDEVVAHLSTCSECRDVMNTTAEMAAVVPARRSWLIPAAVLATAAAIAVGVFLGPAGDGYRMRRNISALSAATANLKERPIQARPSIDIAYRPAAPILRGKTDKETGEAALLLAASDLVEAADRNPSAENLQASGVALLLTGVDDAEAVRQLEEAQAQSTVANADLLNDLAAAYHETSDHKKAEETIERAWILKKSAPIAWTRAVILSTREAWNDYLEIDPNSEWSVEAREKLAQIDN